MRLGDSGSSCGAISVFWGLSRFQPSLTRSLRVIEARGITAGASVIDVGAGNSTLADDLLDRGSTISPSSTSVRSRSTASECASATTPAGVEQRKVRFVVEFLR